MLSCNPIAQERSASSLKLSSIYHPTKPRIRGTNYEECKVAFASLRSNDTEGVHLCQETDCHEPHPLSINLAKLSLSLNCFAGQHKLTFHDYHLRCGNSLIGIRAFEQSVAIPKHEKGGNKKQDTRLPALRLQRFLGPAL